MNCPKCDSEDSRVIETRCYDGKNVMRRRSCTCGVTWPTKEFSCGPPKPTSPPTRGRTEAEHGQPTAKPPVSHPRTSGVSGVLFPESDLSSPGSPDSSKPNRDDRELDGPKALAVVKPSAFTAAMEQFKAAWFARYGVEYSPTASDRSQLGRLLSGKSPAELAALPACFAAYLNDLDPFVAQAQRHNLTWFCTKGNGFNKYRTQAPILSVKEARGQAAGDQWEDMTNARRR